MEARAVANDVATKAGGGLLRRRPHPYLAAGHALVGAAHDDRRTVRISGLPTGSRAARRAIWAELAAAGVDVIADSDLTGLARYLRRNPIAQPEPPRPAPGRTVRRTTPRPTAPPV
jgi:hypothetical protein